jgi:hypothetical protein
MTERWEICVHEAGHVVAGFSLGIPVLRAIAYRTFRKNRSPGITLAARGYCISDREKVVWLMGGHVAQKVVNGTLFPSWIDSSPDYEEALALGTEVYLDGLELAEKFFEAEKETVIRVAELLRDHRGWCAGKRLKGTLPPVS